MHFAFAIFRYFPYGGLQLDMRNIAAACINAGHEVTVYTTLWEDDLIPGVNVIEIPIPQKPTRKRDRAFALALLKEMKLSHHDLVVGFNKIPGVDIYYCGDGCYAAKAFEKHGIFHRLTLRSRVAFRMEKAVFQKGIGTEFLVIARNQIREYQRYYKTEGHRFFVIPPGISRGFIAPANRLEHTRKIRGQLKIPLDKQVVTMVASNLKLKGYERSFKALMALPEQVLSKTILLLVGADKHIQAYKKQARETGLGDHVMFLGGRKDVPEILFGSDALIHPAYREAAGNVILEAAVAGVPVICTKTCGYSFYISENNLGIVLNEPFSQADLNTALSKMLTDAKLRQVWQANTRLFSENNEIFSRISMVVNLFEQKVAKKQKQSTCKGVSLK